MTRIVVTDACIFIDVIELQLISKFFSLDFEVHTTQDILNELHVHQYQILEAYKASGKLTVHVLSGEEQLQLLTSEYPSSLTPEDRSVIFVAEKLEATVLSSDKEVRKFAKKLSVDYHGMLWIFDQLVHADLVSNGEACAKLTQMVNSNLMYRDNQVLQAEVKARVEHWSA